MGYVGRNHHIWGWKNQREGGRERDKERDRETEREGYYIISTFFPPPLK